MPVLYFALDHPAVVKSLLKAGADVKGPLRDTRAFSTGPLPNGSTILHEVSKAGGVETVELLIGAWAVVDARTPGGVTPLGVAVLHGQLAAACALIAAGADVNSKDKSFRTPLSLAEASDTAMTDLLRSHGGK